MEFFSSTGRKRPVRLCESTRKFAFDSLAHVYGLDTMRHEAVSLDGIPGFDDLPAVRRYDLAIRAIAEQAPIRLCEGERISGAATLGLAISHCVPAVRNGKAVFSSVSHLTIDFETVLTRGLDGIRADVERAAAAPRDARAAEFFESCRSVLDSIALWHGRYLAALEGRPDLAENLANLRRVPFRPARTFHEAVQSLWFLFAFVRLCGNWPGIGRIDALLGGYLKRDLAEGRLDLDEAREILAHFFIKGCEWVKGGDCGSGDAQHYQNIVLAGVDRGGADVTNEVTYLVLDVVEELGISDFPISVRLSAATEPRLLERAAEVVRYGGGVLAFYGEETVLAALERYGYPPEAARRFANDGCWEVQIPGETDFAYSPFDALQILQHRTLRGYAGDVSFDSFEALYAAFVRDLSDEVKRICDDHKAWLIDPLTGERRPQTPATVVALFERGCVARGRSYFEGGPNYCVRSPHIGGLPDVVNSLYAIKKAVFDDRLISFPDFLALLRRDWEGGEVLRRRILGFDYFGNDNDECDAVAVRLLHDFALACRANDGGGIFFPPGVSTFGRQLEWAPRRLASPSGRKQGEVLAPNCSPTPGSDRLGATAIVRSYCKPDLSEMTTGAALDLKLLPGSVEGEDGKQALISLLRGFAALGGFFLQPDVADAELLLEAQRHPESYATLSVRVSGWNARFVTLCREWQDMIIDEYRH